MARVCERIEPEVLNAAASVIRCLGHPLRLRLLESLEGGERTVSELQVLNETPQAAVSEQLAVLRGQSIVGARREGPFVYYRILDPKVIRILNCIRGCDTRPGRKSS